MRKFRKTDTFNMNLPGDKLQFYKKVLNKFFEAKAADYRMIREPAETEPAPSCQEWLRSPSVIILRKNVFLLRSFV